MKKPSDREINRRLKRQKATNQIRRKYSAPKIEIHAQLASPTFKKQVESILATIDFDQPPFEYAEIGLFFQNLSQLGLEKSYKVLSDAFVKRLSKVQHNGPPRRIEVDPLQFAVQALGDFIVGALCDIDESIFPMNDVEVRIQGNSIELGLSSMLHREVDDQDIYISRKRLQVEVDEHPGTQGRAPRRSWHSQLPDLP